MPSRGDGRTKKKAQPVKTPGTDVAGAPGAAGMSPRQKSGRRPSAATPSAGAPARPQGRGIAGDPPAKVPVPVAARTESHGHSHSHSGAPGPGLAALVRAELEKSDMFNRELSWLDFNARVLAQASNPATPLLERVKFLSIFSTNLDEFFMVRVAGLKEQVRTMNAEGPGGAGGDEPARLLEAISRRVRELVALQAKVWQKELVPALAAAELDVVPRSEWSAADERELKKYFQKQVYPVLSPLGIDPAHPFPHLPNKSLSLIVQLRSRSVAAGRAPGPTGLTASADDPNGGGGSKLRYALVEVPQILPRFVPLPRVRGPARFVLLRDVIGQFLPLLFAGAEVLDGYVIRITRDSDLDVDDDDVEDLLKTIEAELHQRHWGNVVRLEISNRAPDEVVRFLRDSLRIEKRDVYPIEGPLNFGDFMWLARLPGFDRLKYTPFSPHVRAPWRTAKSPFDLIRSKDLVVHHPYESFSTTMDFIEAAAIDPDVLAIKLTLYRTSAESPIVRSLIRAAQNGKQVVALVELKARFDEANNIHWARQLERGGAHVVYGIVGLKTHCKACLVVRREGKALHRYAHLSTGNYNPTTANLYTDLGLFTADPQMCEDVANLFNVLTGFAHHVRFNAIVPSPEHLPARLKELVVREAAVARAGGKGRIVCKMNSLVDPTLTAALYDASRAGVKIDLIVRGICCLRPGVPDMSENIRVTSIVGRFLEHTRAFHFGNGGEPEVYLSSADWMQRNFYSRVEVLFPLRDLAARRRVIDEILESVLKDTANAWELRSDGTWRRKSPSGTAEPFDSQAHFMKIEERLARETKA